MMELIPLLTSVLISSCVSVSMTWCYADRVVHSREPRVNATLLNVESWIRFVVGRSSVHRKRHEKSRFK